MLGRAELGGVCGLCGRYANNTAVPGKWMVPPNGEIILSYQTSVVRPIKLLPAMPTPFPRGYSVPTCDLIRASINSTDWCMNNDISKDYIETEILSFKWMDLDQKMCSGENNIWRTSLWIYTRDRMLLPVSSSLHMGVDIHYYHWQDTCCWDLALVWTLHSWAPTFLIKISTRTCDRQCLLEIMGPAKNKLN